MGELLVWAVEAGILGVVLVAAHLNSSLRVRRDSWSLLGLMVALALFAVLVDMIHIAFESDISQRSNSIFGLVETAGELGVMLLILLLAVWIVLRSDPSAADTGDEAGSLRKRR